MAYNDDQSEQQLPGGSNGRKRKSESHLPRYFRTQPNKKFLNSTLDQLIQPGIVEKLNGYVGRKTAKAFTVKDNYISDVSTQREAYQLEPATVIKDKLGNISFYKDYNDYTNQLNNLNKNLQDHSIFNQQEYYAWDPHVNWDKLTNFREYYWLPTGPQSFGVPGTTIDVESTYTVRIGDNVDNNTYVFSPDGLTQNPTITLYRGITYKFDIDTPNLPFTIKTKKTLEEGFELDSSSILVLEGVSVQGLEKGVSTLQLGTDTPDVLYYVAANDLQASGTIVVKDISEATFIDVESEIIGKKYYKASNGVELSNGMKVYFTGEVEPASYAEGAFYVEGVGDKIKLISEVSLNVPTAFTADIDIEFDAQGFDRLPFEQAIGYPQDKDYFVINRSAKDGNLWSRYNRWFHKSVIEISAAQNGQPVELDQLQRAKRPIIEFDADIKLHKFGTKAKVDVDLVDDFTKDVFSTIEGSIGYNIDGVDIVKGMRILFTADTDILVKNRIFEVDFIKFAGGQASNNQITLKEVTDSIPQENEVVLALSGSAYKGKTFYYANGTWNIAQEKTQTNQPPLFDIFDQDGHSYSDTSVYTASTFSGNKLFSYKVGTGSNDTELGFPLSYRSISNVGDIVFDFNLLQDTITYTIDNEIFSQTTDVGYVRKYNSLTDYETFSGWKKVSTLSEQPVIRQYTFDNTFSEFIIDVYDSSALLDDLWVRVYLNNKLQFIDKDYTIGSNVNNNATVNFTNALSLNDVVVIKTKSSALKNDNGYYEIPASLERNPKNENLSEFTLGEVNDHVASIVENLDTFNGTYPGVSNLRDLGNLTELGRRFLQHSAPMNLPLYHITDKDSNVVKSLKYARKEYAKFKRLFLQLAESSEFQGSVKQHVDSILAELSRDKNKRMPFYFSDMVPTGATQRNEYEVIDADETFFALSTVFKLNVPSRKAVQVYINGTQLVHNRDYTFNDNGFCVITATKQPGDLVEIYEYETTNGSYVPPTPSKLGLYPAYTPEKYLDNTYQTPQYIIQGHDGSRFIAFDDYRDDLLLELEKRIFNNIKVTYDTSLFDIHNLVPGEYRNTGVSLANLNKTMLSDFIQWSKLIDQDYTQHTFFERTNRFTFNYNNSTSPSGKELPGFWRSIYKHAFDTDRPHTHPWEMLGFTIQPTWWNTQYGPAPYTSDNQIMWADIEAGIVRQPNVKYKVLNKFKRPGLTRFLPVDSSGNLLPPLDIGWINDYQPDTIDYGFTFGDGAPVEAAWRNSSEYPFSVITAFVLNKPSLAFATGFDRINQVRNVAGSIVYKPTNKRIKLTDIVFPNTADDTVQNYTSGLINYISNYMTSDVLSSYSKYKEDIKNIDNQLGFKLAGFTDKEKFKLILDSRTPLNEGNVFVPDENYKIFLNTSSPVRTINYSGVIIERREDGYVIKGYNTNTTTFKYYPSVALQSDPSINIGGISESYVDWDSGKTYVPGQNVLYQGVYYRTKTQHVSTSSFDETSFSKLPYLPLIGGRNAFVRKSFVKSRVDEIEYGTLFTSIQDVVDFLLGYGAYLESQGFIFDYFDGNTKVVLDWRHSVNEFLFWTTQKWASGSVITLSPAASQLKFNSKYSMVDNIFDGFYGYSLFKSDGNKLVEDFANLGRQPNEFILRPKNTADGIYGVDLPLIQKEHVVLIDNKTVFGDVIFDQQPGYRQERIKVLGYRTDEWDGSLNIPGFIYDDAKIVTWEPWTDYAIGSIVKNKEFYYSATSKVPGTELFDAASWSFLPEKPEGGLYANFEYKTNQFADFYDLDSDNFDTEQQKLAQHLIGYQKRQYLENIINDDVSQYKFYQGMIQDKGTKNALTKLFDALASDNKDSLEFYEEWAIKDGQYGASDGFDEVEYLLDESKFRLVPQPIELVDRVTGNETDLIYRIRPFETYQKSENYNHAPFPEAYVFDSYTKNSGYVNQQDVRGITTNYDNILDFSFASIRRGHYIWVGNDNRTWNVYKHIDTDYQIESIGKGDTSFNITLSTNANTLAVGEIIGVHSVYDYVEAAEDSTTDVPTTTRYNVDKFYKITNISNNVITVATSVPVTEEILKCRGSISAFTTARASDIVAANVISQNNVNLNDLLWIDNISENQEWAVYKNVNQFSEQHRILNDRSGTGHNYGTAISTDDRNTTLLIGSPDNSDGKVFVYNRPTNSLNYTLTQVLEPFKTGDDNERFGASVALSPDAKYAVVGSPNASNVKTKFQGPFVPTQDYPKNSIVSKDQGLWRALVNIEGQEDNIQFNSFYSVAQVISELGLENTSSISIPAMLVGNYSINPVSGSYAFAGQSTNHILVRAPLSLYEGSGVNDQVKLAWNSITYANQDLAALASRAPFNGTVSVITDAFITQEHTIQRKIDAVLYLNAATSTVFVGDILSTDTAVGTVDYVYSDGAELVIYLTDVNGAFNLEDSLFRSDGDFIGEYIRQAPVDDIDITGVWGGYWWIDTPEYTPTSATSISDKAAGLVYYDVISDSTPTGRYYYNSLDYSTTDINSQNTFNAYIRTLSYQGLPGAGGSNDPFLSKLYVMRAPKVLTDSLSQGDAVSVLVNQLPQYTTGNFKDLTTIGLNTTITNTTRQLYDIWDGYINIDFTKFLEGNPFEPRIGDTVQDLNTGARAVVTYYQRDAQNITIFVKNVTGTWSRGNDYGQNAEIKFLGTPGDPNVIYQVDRIMGEIQYVSLGYAPAGIGKLLVFEAQDNIALTDNDILNDAEYWMYTEGNVLGIPRAANPPSSVNNEWEQVFKIPTDVTGTASGLTNEGTYSIFSRAAPGRYDLIGTYTVPEKQNNFKLGSNLKITKYNDLYRLMIHAEGTKTESSPGRIYFVKTGVENGITYTWEYAKDKKFKGVFNESINYATGDVVYRDITRGTLYTAKTNLAPGLFDNNDWTSTDDLIDYVGYIPNNTGLSVINDSTDGSTVLDQNLLNEFGSEFDVSTNGDVLIVNAIYDAQKPNKVVVYRSNNGHFERRQELPAPDKTSGFGHSLAISDDGMWIAIGAPFNDDYKLDQGKVYIYNQVNGVFVLHQELQSPNNERAEKFGWRLQYDGEKLHITSRNADTKQKTVFDTDTTVFDGSFTEFRTARADSGVIHVYEKTPQGMLYAQSIQIVDNDVNNFGRTLLAKNNHLYVGLPIKESGSKQGQVIDFRIPENVNMWETYRQSNPTVDVDKIKKVFLYNTVEGEILTYLDYIDPIQGKVAGPAEQELTFKTYFDPATYSISSATSTTIDPTNSWGPEHVGEVWWNLENAKFYNPYQGSIEYSTQNWNKIFQGNTIDIYEWVESDVLPSVWDSLADTENGFKKGYSGTSVYQDTAYSTRSVYDNITQTFKVKYYFWVQNKTIVPDAEFRNISIKEIAQYIEDPFAKGHKYVAFISPTRFVLYNCDNLIKGKEVAISVQFWTIDNQKQNIHNQYQIVSEGLETSQPNTDTVNKWFDSLIGYDVQGRRVPDVNLSEKKKYGTLNRPRQSWFKNKNEALKQFIERTNLVLKENIIVDDKDISPLLLNDPILTPASELYDVKVLTLDDLSSVGTSNVSRAVLTPVVQDGKIVDVVIANEGKGYRIPPKVTVLGKGSGAVIKVSIDGVGQVSNVEIVDQGENYDSTTTLSVRRFSILVEADDTIQGKWALYERITESSTWNRIRSQSYNVALYWDYTDWYASGYSETTNIDYLIDNSYELTSLDDNIGDIVKINSIGSGGWLLLEKEDNQDTEDYTINYKTVGRQDGTIQFKNSLYDSATAFTGFDTISFDTKIFDSEPTKETRIVLSTIKDNLLIDELLIEFNKLFFASLRYVFAEQTYVDWAFKTSFIKAKHNVGSLREDITFNNDNLPSYESYIKEVKPFSTKIREYLSAYEGLDNTGTVTTDFDLPAAYSNVEGRIIPQNVKVVDDVLVGTNTNLETYPNKNWLDNSSYSVVSVVPVNQGKGYTSPPILKAEGGGGAGTVLKAYLGSAGNVVKVDVLQSGSGYYSTPVITVNGNLVDGGEPATFSCILGNNPVRGITTTVKFDRTTGSYVYTKLNQTETFTTGGNLFAFDLAWPMSLLKTDIAVYVNNIELLSDEYSYDNVLDTSKGYDRHYGRITFVEKPAKNSTVLIEYKLSTELMHAQDRINNLYDPSVGQLGKELGQLMSGIDYGGVEVKSFGWERGQGWDADTWFESTWDSYDNTYKDEIFEFDGSTISIELSTPLEDGIEYHVYKNNVRLDDPNFDGSTIVDNPNAIMRSLIGDGITKTLYLDDFKISTYQEDGNNTGAAITVTAGDILIIRKSTSDGTFLPNETTYDSIIQGGNLNYSTATGLDSADITIDGDGFVTATTSAGPEEQVPGQILDTVDIKVYERPKGGSSPTTSMNYIGDGITTTFAIGTEILQNNSLFVKLGFDIIDTAEYTVDYTNSTITFNVAPALNTRINISSLGVSGTKIIDIDTIVADGSTVSFLTNVRYDSHLQYIITLDGSPIENVVKKSTKADGIANNALIKFAVPPAAGQKIRYVFFEGDIDTKNYSEVIIDKFIADGSTTTFELSTIPGVQQPAAFFTIVKVNNKILSAGYSKRYTTTATQLEYPIEEFQFPPGSISNKQVKVFLNNEELTYLDQWTFVGNSGSLVRLKTNVQQKDGDTLLVYVMSDGEYRFGYFNVQNELVETPGVLYLDSAYNENDEITVYQFTNHNWQDIQRIEYDVIDRISLTAGTDDWYTYVHLQNGLIALREEAIDAQYVWVSLNGDLLIPSVHYYVSDNRRYLKLNVDITENDNIQLVHFAAPKTKNKFGWTQFKDMLNRTHYKRLTNQGDVKLASELHWYDQSITVVNGSSLPQPLADSRTPAVIFIDGERIEYFVRNGNVISHMRRGTLGTGVKDVYAVDTPVYNQSAENTMPYKDETLTTLFDADGTTGTYELDFTPNSVNEFEVFVAGKRLRKNSINSYKFETTDLSGNIVSPIAQDSPEGDEILAPEFTINGNQLILAEIPLQSTKVIVVRRRGILWTEPGTSLGDSNSNIANFLRAATVDLPR